MLKKIGIVSLIIFLLIVFVGCHKQMARISHANNENVEISFSWWGNDDRHEYTLKIIEKFEEKYPYITVNTDYSEWNGYKEKLESKILSNTEPDIMQINYDWMKIFSRTGDKFYDLDELSQYLHFDRYTDNILQHGQINGKLKAIPIAMNVRIFFFNKDIFDIFGLDLPNTWDDIFNAGEIMSREKYYPLEMDEDTLWNVSVAYMEQVTGKEIIDNQGYLNANEEDLKLMLEFCYKLFEKKCCLPINEKEKFGYANGIYAGTMQWLNEGNKYAKKLKKSENLTAGSIIISENAKRSGWYIKPACMYVIKADTNYPKESAMFLEFMLNDEEAVKIQGIDKGIPVNSEAIRILEKENMLHGVTYDAYKETLDTKLPLNNMNDYFERLELKQVYKKAIDNILYNNVSIEDETKKVLIDINNTLEKFRN